MSLFSLGRQPRRFQHKPIYYDEQKETLKNKKRKTFGESLSVPRNTCGKESCVKPMAIRPNAEE